MKEKNTQKGFAKVMLIIGAILICVVIAFVIFKITNGDIKKYNISFETNGGSVVETFSVDENSLITKPENPTKENYDFAGWYYNNELFDFSTPVKQDIKLEAKWVLAKNDVEVDEDKKESLIISGENNNKEENKETSNKAENNETSNKENSINKDNEDKTEETKNKYTVTFVNYDGTVLESKIEEQGAIPTYTKENPTKPADKQYTYTFAGWGPNITPVERNTEYVAKYQKTVNKYTVVFNNEDGTKLSDDQVLDYGTVAVEPETPINEGYDFLGWYNGEEKFDFTEEVKDNLTLTAKWEISKYTVTFANYDGTVLETKVEKYGTIPAYTMETPTRQPDNVYRYEFEKWDKEWVEVTEDVTYTAIFKEIYIDYEIKFIDEDGTEISKKLYHYGDIVEVPENPTKNADAQYTYTFIKWNPEINAVEADAVYTAIYDKTLNTYTVKFVDEDGKELAQEQSVEYGSTAKEPQKPSKVGYELEGWYNGEVKYEFTETITENIVLTAKWTKNKYTVTFVNYDGTILETKAAEYGSIPTYTKQIPKKPSDNIYKYSFKGWDKDIVEMTEDATYTATYKEKFMEYEVKFVNDDGTEISTKTYHYGDTVEIPANPTKNTTAQYTYTFAGWSPEVTTVLGATTYTATYSKTLNSYKVKFVDTDGTVLADEQTVRYGSPANEPKEPTKQGQAFEGWYNGDVKHEFTKPIIGDITLTAKWVKNKCKVTFVNHDGTILETKLVEYGDIPTYTKQTPTKQSDNVYKYTFKGWDKEIVEVTENVTYTANYDKTYVDYEIKFVNDDGTVINATKYHYGDTVQVPTNPTKNADAQFTYTFANWSPKITTVKRDMTYTAEYSKTVNSYIVTFKDEDGAKLADDQKVEYGKTAKEPPIPVKEGSEFECWYNEGKKYEFREEVKGNVSLTAKWKKAKYTVTFANYDGTVLETKTVEAGNVPTYTKQTPTKQSDNVYKYIFKGWDKQIVEVTGNVTYTAIYDKTYIDYEVKFVNDDGTVINTTKYHYGDTVKAPSNPVKTADAQYTYTFANWTPEIKTVEGSAIYTATYTKTLNKYSVTFKDTDGTKLAEEQKVEYGSVAKEPQKPTKVGHTFLGWYNGETKYGFTEAVKGNVSLTAKWEKAKYTLTFKNYDGTVLETKTVEYGNVPEYTKQTPTKPADSTSPYKFVGWSPAITEVVENATYTATYKYFMNVDKTVETGLSNLNCQKFNVTKNGNTINVKFKSYKTTNIFGMTTTKKPPYKFVDMFSDVAKLLNSLSNKNYKSFELYYKYPGDTKGESINLMAYDLTDSSPSSWYGGGPNDRVGEWVGYLATGKLSTMGAYQSNSNSLVGKTITGTITLKDGFVSGNGTEKEIFYITFSN